MGIMNMDAQSGPVTLAAALVEWMDSRLVEAIRHEEQALDPDTISRFWGYSLESLRTEIRSPVTMRPMQFDGNAIIPLRGAWDSLIGAFKFAVQHGDLVLTGVSTRLNHRPRTVIAPSDAAVLNIDPPSGSISIGLSGERFLAVHVMRNGVCDANTGEEDAVAKRPIPPSPVTAETVSELTDDEIIVLLNEHIRRVVESRTPKMMARIKDVLQPIIEHRLDFRGKNGLLAETLNAEARELQSWIGVVANWHRVPGPTTIENNIRDRYRQLKAQSNAMNP